MTPRHAQQGRGAENPTLLPQDARQFGRGAERRGTR